MAKTNWNTGDIITKDKVNLIETKVEALLNTVNSLVGVVRGLENYINKVKESEVYGLDDDLETKDDIGYNSPEPITINPEETGLLSLINNTITGRINTTWPDTATLENAGDDIVGIEGGDSLATSVNSLKRYIDKCMNESYGTLIHNIQEATNEYYSRYVKGDILITTISREKEGEEKGNTLSNENTNSYWVPFGQGRMLIGAGTDVIDVTNTRSFEAGDAGGEYNHKINISATATKPGVKTKKVTANSNGTPVATSLKAAPTITIKGNGTFDLLPPYIVVYFYKCCDEEEYNTYYSIVEETETDSSSEGTENSTPSEGTSTDSENP